MDKLINNHTVKGLQEFLKEDKSLTECMDYEEFESKKAAPNNSDDRIMDAYQAYCTAKNG